LRAAAGLPQSRVPGALFFWVLLLSDVFVEILVPPILCSKRAGGLKRKGLGDVAWAVYFLVDGFGLFCENAFYE
jgi:hypothetical protein